MAKIFTATAETDEGKVIAAQVFSARGWKHAESLVAENLYEKEGATTQRLHKHSSGARMEECDSCDGVGLMEGWNLRDGSTCPKCHGAAAVVIEVLTP